MFQKQWNYRSSIIGMLQGKDKKRITLHHKLMSLVWLNITMFLVIAGIGIHMSQRIYRQDMEIEISNVFQATFTNMENTLGFADNIALNLMNDKTVKKALRAVNQNSETKYILVDELYYRIITGSLVANDSISIIIMDQEGRQYATGGLTENLTEEEQQTLMALFEGRSHKTKPVWFERGNGKTLVYGREIYDSPFGGQKSLGIILINIDMGKMMAGRDKGSMTRGTVLITYNNQLVYANDPLLFDQEILPEVYEAGGKNGYFVVTGNSGFEGMEYVGFKLRREMTNSTNTLVIFFTAAILVILILSFLMTVWVVRQITSPIAFLTVNMKSVEKGNFSTQIDLEELGTQVLDLQDLAANFNLMTAEIERLVKDNYLRTIKEKEYQIKVLQSQINPHFLYNTLDAINWLAADSDKPEISSMVQSLAAIFREATRQQEYMISLKDEMSLLACYVTIQKIRMGERVQFHIYVPQECLDLKIPKLSLQPILENSVKYAAEVTFNPCDIRIYAKKKGDLLILYVWDNGPGIDKKTLKRIREHRVSSDMGIGLLNIDERVQMLGGSKSGIWLYSTPGKGTLIKLIICQQEVEHHEIPRFDRR